MINRYQKQIDGLNKIASGEVLLSGSTGRFISDAVAALEEAVDKSRQRLIKAREKLAATINKNRALTELRHELQRWRWEGRDFVLPKKEPPTEGRNLHQMELKY